MTSPPGPEPPSLPGIDWPAPIARPVRLAPARLPAALWAQLVAHEPTRQRYLSRVHRRGPDACWYWLGAISDTGHGKLRAGTRNAGPGEPASRVVTAHVYGWHLTNGLAASSPALQLVAHTCDEPACQNPAHWQLDDASGNLADYHHRRAQPGGPLTDTRGPAGRARAIGAAIRTAIAGQADIDAAIGAAIAVGISTDQMPLF